MSRPAECLQNFWQNEFQKHSLIPFDSSKNNGSLVYFDLTNPQFWWHNPTNYNSLRLTKDAFFILNKTSTVPKWKIKITEAIKPKNFVQLERHFKSPYFLQTMTVIHVFGESDASMLALHGGDLQQYLNNHD